MAEMTPPPGRRESKIPELAVFELRSTSAIRRYAEETRRLAKDFAHELESAATEIEVVLAKSGQGNPLLLGWDNRLRAKKVADRAYRAAELQRGCAVEMTRLWHDFLIAYAPLLQKVQEPEKVFDFDN